MSSETRGKCKRCGAFAELDEGYCDECGRWINREFEKAKRKSLARLKRDMGP